MLSLLLESASLFRMASVSIADTLDDVECDHLFMFRLWTDFPSSELPRRCDRLLGLRNSPSNRIGSGLVCRCRKYGALGFDFEETEADFLTVRSDEDVELERERLLACGAGAMLVFKG